MLFGLTSTPMYSWLKFGRKVLLHVLSNDDDAKVILPSLVKVRFYQEVIGLKYPLCHDVWAAADGLKLLIQKAECEKNRIITTMAGLTPTTLTVYLFFVLTVKFRYLF